MGVALNMTFPASHTSYDFTGTSEGLPRPNSRSRFQHHPQYVSALERQDGEKVPSMKILKEIVHHLARDSEKGLWDYQAARDLTFSGLDLNVPFVVSTNIDQELASQAKSPEGSEIWVISNILLESEERQFARDTLSNIMGRNMTYTYFIPSEKVEAQRQWDRAYSWMEDEAKTVEGGLAQLNERVSAFELSGCAFSSRMRITNPRGSNPDGCYGIGGRLKAEYLFLPAPLDLVFHTRDTLSTLLRELEDKKNGQSGDKLVAGNEDLGFIRRIFP